MIADGFSFNSRGPLVMCFEKQIRWLIYLISLAMNTLRRCLAISKGFLHLEINSDSQVLIQSLIKNLSPTNISTILHDYGWLPFNSRVTPLVMCFDKQIRWLIYLLGLAINT